MNKSAMKGLVPGTAAFVVMHGNIRAQRGKAPSTPYSSIVNPKLAFQIASYSLDYGTECEEANVTNICMALFEDAPPSKLEIQRQCQLMDDPGAFQKELKKILEDDDEYSFVAVVDEKNSLAVAKGTDIKKVITEAAKRGVKNPFIVHV